MTGTHRDPIVTDKAKEAIKLIKWILWIVLIVLVILILLPMDRDSRATDGSFEVTAYCPCVKCCGEFADGITASGKPAMGLICAADPKYPFGTKMTIKGITYTVEDRGGAIKGNKIDLLFATHQEALNWGRKKIKVKILK